MYKHNKNALVLERVGERIIMLELIKKKERDWLGHWLRNHCLLKGAVEEIVNGKNIRGVRRYRGRKLIGISGSLIWSKTLMELMFNPCGEFR